ncbi:unnamed protein product [Vitrella brassicaformis CCMP3155]|uniref:Uncharacterized protein n=1 Tax=Vitrella brassicaformis (strain CCMP3155) TaxID=1169540 RepID=A0A0G4GAY8_VITBC|nr:unnamed protein product [Vitrella brassicaformis CCMP3155]|eukprot:CEM26294.1 unnamed protein product [Vitrella brassicaformis CCMP3155]
MAQPSSASSQAPHAAAPSPGCKGLDDVDFLPDEGVTTVSGQLLEGCIRRSFTEASYVTSLIQQGADPRATGGLRVRGTAGTAGRRYSCLSFAIDSPTNIPSLYARGDDYPKEVPVVLPQWSSRQLQRDIINALVDGGADVNADPNLTEGSTDRPIKMAIRAGNLTAVEALLSRQANVRGVRVMRPPYIPYAARPVSCQYEAALMSVFRRLIQHDSTLAAERSVGGENLVHEASRHFATHTAFSQLFMDEYLTLITSRRVNMTATDNFGRTPLHEAAGYGSPCVAHWLCRQLTADDVNRGRPNRANLTPLAEAARTLDEVVQRREADRIDEQRTVIRVLLRGGAVPSIARMPTATEVQHRRCQRRVLAEYATVLNELSEAVMSAINTALAPQRSLAALLTPRLAVGPQEAPVFAWRIASYLFDIDAAMAAIDESIPLRNSRLFRRVRAAVTHFVKSALHASSNREVVGVTGSLGGVMVRVPLQCFAVSDGADSRPPHVVHTAGRLGLREVVHKARLDEAASHGVVGVVKGFNEHLGDQDCQFAWQQLGHIDRQTGLFVSLGID